MKRKHWLRLFSVLLCTTALAEPVSSTFTVVYKTNAEVEMGRVEYTVGDAANAFPQPGQFKAFFSSFMTRAKQKGSVYIAGENQRWFTDAAFTSPASFPSGQSGEIYTVYCKLTNNLTIFSIVNNAEDVPYQTITSYQQPRLSIWNYSGPDGREGPNQLRQALKMMIEKQNADGTWSLVPTCKTDYDGTEWYDTSFSTTHPKMVFTA